MRVDRLEIEGFGPFADRQVIEFAELNAVGLFLLAGPTGVGKTSILDAICFALYGKTTAEGQATGPTDGRSGEELRSTNATPDQPTRVTLDFTVGGRRYRIKRHPSYQRPKQRGEGVTTEVAAVALSRLKDECDGSSPDHWEPLAQKSGDVGKRIVEILGFNADQFRRVMVIPQGRFREVLVSDSKDREELLSAIFGTDVYKRYEEAVREAANGLGGAVESAKRELVGVLVGSPFEGRAEDDGLVGAIESARGKAESRLRRAGRGLESRESTFKRTNSDYGRAVQLDERFENLEKASKSLERAREERAEFDPTAVELRAADAAAPVVRAMKKRGGIDAAISEETGKRKEMLETLADVDAKLKEAEEAHAAATSADKELDPKRVELVGLRKRVEAAGAGADDRAAKNKRLEEAKTALDAANERQGELGRALSKAKTAKREANDAWVNAVAEERRHHAVRLAKSLESGCPCPVCGSESHPNPAAESTEKALPDVDGLQSRLQNASDEVERIGAMIEAGNDSINEVRDRWLQAKEAVDKLDDEIDVAKDEEAIQELERVLGEANAARQQAEDAARELGESRSKRKEALSEISGRIATLSEARTEAVGEIEALIRATEFEDEDQVRSAHRDDAWRTGMRERLERIEESLRDASSRVAALSEALADVERPDVEALEQRLEAAKSRFVRATDFHARLNGRAEDLAGLHKRVSDRLGKIEADRREHRILSQLKDWVAPRNNSGQASLHEWVLAALLEEVLGEASDLMTSLSKGRYTLVRSAAPMLDGSPRQGKVNALDIDVEDAHKGGRRAVRTLSGGESFLAALALSLSIARITERHQGGRPLEMLFIDEGFGSLDPESLELAMDALQSLRKEGRVVGVISHVEEMKRSISAQIRLSRADQSTELSVELG